MKDPVFDAHGAATARDEAIARVDAASARDDSWWRQNAEDAVRFLAAQCRPFTSEDVLRISGHPEVSDHRALGATISTLSKRGVIRKTGEYVRAKSRSRHRAPIAVWIGTERA